MNRIIDKLFNKKNKKHHWFEVRYIYSLDGYKKFDYVTQIGLTELKTSLDRRALKKIPLPLHKIKQTKKILCNGKLEVEIICNLGYFSK